MAACGYGVSSLDAENSARGRTYRGAGAGGQVAHLARAPGRLARKIARARNRRRPLHDMTGQ